MITSAKNPRWDNDCEIADLKSCGLPAPSVVRPAKIATIDLGRISGTLGHLPISEAKAVRAFITQSLA
jgi:mRNA interferase MazF